MRLALRVAFCMSAASACAMHMSILSMPRSPRTLSVLSHTKGLCLSMSMSRFVAACG